MKTYSVVFDIKKPVLLRSLKRATLYISNTVDSNNSRNYSVIIHDSNNSRNLIAFLILA